MGPEHEASIEDEVLRTTVKRPHVVVLGAGASRAAFLNGDKNQHILPLMNDFVNVTGTASLLIQWGLDPKENFESLYSDLHSANRFKEINELNRIISLYFSELELPDTPTLYDHLILSLRGKDLIATFNWDPLLVQAFIRNKNSGLVLPRMVFLHGNVAVGYCKKCHKKGNRLGYCRVCSESFIATPILYPVKEKNYAENSFIANEWEIFKRDLKQTYMLTIFGYSGPKTDTEAISAMREAWGSKEERSMEQTAFITTQSEEEINTNWDKFIHTHHYEVNANFYDSWIANHPRRTGEAYIHQYIDAKFIENNPVPTNLDFPELWKWYQQFKEPESKNPDFK